jgi:hypothetical protein
MGTGKHKKWSSDQYLTRESVGDLHLHVKRAWTDLQREILDMPERRGDSSVRGFHVEDLVLM